MPLAAPTADELMQNPVVQKALLDAWNEQPANAARRHEEGGWIYMDISNGKITVERAFQGSHHRIDLTQPVVILMSVVVAKFHTHPNPSSEGWDP